MLSIDPSTTILVVLAAYLVALTAIVVISRESKTKTNSPSDPKRKDDNKKEPSEKPRFFQHTLIFLDLSKAESFGKRLEKAKLKYSLRMNSENPVLTFIAPQTLDMPQLIKDGTILNGHVEPVKEEAQPKAPKQPKYKHVLEIMDLAKAQRLMQELKDVNITAALEMNSGDHPTITFTHTGQLTNVDEFRTKNIIVKFEIVPIREPEEEEFPRLNFS